MRVAPPSLVATALFVVVTLFLLEEMSRQLAFHVGTVICVWPIAVVLLFDFVMRVLVVRPWRRSGALRWQWMCTPVCVAVLLSAMLHPWLIELRFAVSRSAFEAARVEVAEHGVQRARRWVGLFPVESIHLDEGGQIHFVVGRVMVDPCSISYMPSERRRVNRIEPFGDGWFAIWWCT